MNFDILKKDNPFERFLLKNKESQILSWSKPFDYDVFQKVLTICKPKTIIELGSFLGYSTTMMLKICNELNLQSEIVCVDTWLGGSDHYIHNDDLFFKFFNLKNGISSIFDQFCINIVNEKMDTQVIPFPNTTDNAFIYFKHRNISADLIFVDASHTKTQVYNDIKNYYSLLNEHGTIFGHDINWSDIREAVDTFCDEQDLSYKTFHDKYWMIEPK